MNRAAFLPLRLRRSLHASLIALLCSACWGAGAQPVPPAATTSAAVAEPEWKPAAKVGDATVNLLALQASGAAASPTARPIPGELAGRSYQRYLKSFEYPIPERFGPSVKSPGLNNGSAP